MVICVRWARRSDVGFGAGGLAETAATAEPDQAVEEQEQGVVAADNCILGCLDRLHGLG
jgi:hypothetical protein